MNIPFFALGSQNAALQPELDEAVLRVVRSQRFILGPEVEALEGELAAYLGVKHAIACASGTDALLLPLKALGAPAGSDVIVPAFTFFATAGTVWNAGYRPVFCDVDPNTFNVSAETLEAAWTERTVVVVPVHLFGQMAPMGPIRGLAAERGAFVLEDCAQAIGARSSLGMAGTVGDAGAYSFFPTKNLGAFGDGGLIATGDDALADKLAKLRVHGGRRMYHHEMVGTNSRLDALQAAVLRVKLRHLDAWGAVRGENACRYPGLLAGVPGLRLPGVAEGSVHVWYQYTVRAERRDALRACLERQGIGSAVYYPEPLHLQPCFASLGGRRGDLPVAEALGAVVVSLPIFPELGEERLARVADAVRGFYGGGGS
ncbi:MAG: DegT/DnrJ/EryC1/StrS family aminotransferase [Gemmatimonadetes bacterium]|nr:DegT/DnrJ/EryC1/StrS family aminotransferase [Gemmatimonadota bacterium]